MAESCKWLVLNVRKLKSVCDSKTLGPVKYNRLVSYITIDPLDDDIDHEFIGQCRAELGQLEQWPNIDETREILRAVPGSFAEEIIRSRGDR